MSPFSCEVTLFCPIFHYKRHLIFQQLNIKYLNGWAVAQWWFLLGELCFQAATKYKTEQATGRSPALFYIWKLLLSWVVNVVVEATALLAFHRLTHNEVADIDDVAQLAQLAANHAALE